MNILITGSNGFVGKNLKTTLETIIDGRNTCYPFIKEDTHLFLYDIDTEPALLDSYCVSCDLVFHLAGVNRAKDVNEFMTGNFGFTTQLLETLKKHNNKAPVVITSSIQAALDNPYGKSKKAAEDYLFAYSKETGVPVFVFRLPNVFGKWCRPNYNSVVATFCNNIARDLPIQVNDPEAVLNLVYIDDVVDSLIKVINQDVLMKDALCSIPTLHTVKLGQIAQLLRSFKESRKNLSIPNMMSSFEKALYSTYLSYLPENRFSYPLTMHEDERGSFTEIIRTLERGQFSVNMSNPGITKGNHWHHTKNEKFVVVSGEALIKFRKIGTDKVIEYPVSGTQIEVVDIPTGYTHSITNTGSEMLVTFMWANECFNPQKPDTFFEEV